MRGALLGIVYIVGLFYYFTSTEKSCSSAVSQTGDLSAYTSNYKLYSHSLFDSIKIGKRALPPFKTAMKVLAQKLSESTTDRDSLDVLAAFVYRVFDFMGEEDPNYDSHWWNSLSFEDMYNNSRFDSGGVYCGERATALAYLLKKQGFTDVLEYSVNGIHTFLLVRTRDNKPWITDGYDPYGYMIDSCRADFISYLLKAKENPVAIACISLPAVFGLPDNLKSKKWDGYFTSQIFKTYMDTVKKNPFCDTCYGRNSASWVPKYIFKTEAGSNYSYKTLGQREGFAVWANKQAVGFNASSLWLIPDSVANVSYGFPKWADAVWANNLIKEIDLIRSK